MLQRQHCNLQLIHAKKKEKSKQDVKNRTNHKKIKRNNKSMIYQKNQMYEHKATQVLKVVVFLG